MRWFVSSLGQTDWSWKDPEESFGLGVRRWIARFRSCVLHVGLPSSLAIDLAEVQMMDSFRRRLDVDFEVRYVDVSEPA